MRKSTATTISCTILIPKELRSLGIKVVFLPAYCPFFNPIEIMFGWIKKRFLRYYIQNSKRNLTVVISEIMNEFQTTDFSNIYKKCGYTASGFNAGTAFNQDITEFGYS